MAEFESNHGFPVDQWGFPIGMSKRQRRAWLAERRAALKQDEEAAKKLKCAAETKPVSPSVKPTVSKPPEGKAKVDKPPRPIRKKPADHRSCTVYQLYSTRDHAPRYVGQTRCKVATRLGFHLSAARSGKKTKLYHWIRQEMSEGHQIRIAPIHENTEWNMTERRVIADWRLRGVDLLNVLDGGNDTLEKFLRRQKAAKDELKEKRRARAAAALEQARERKKKWGESGHESPRYGTLGPAGPARSIIDGFPSKSPAPNKKKKRKTKEEKKKEKVAKNQKWAGKLEVSREAKARSEPRPPPIQFPLDEAGIRVAVLAAMQRAELPDRIVAGAFAYRNASKVKGEKGQGQWLMKPSEECIQYARSLLGEL